MAGASSIESAMLAARNAAARGLEARHRVADTISEEILARPDAAMVADEVLEFLSGPWAQVVAQARISNQRGISDADGFAALIPVLIWSVQPELARKNQPMLVRQVPKLVAKLREGLATIQYPEHDSFAFFEVLMVLHERGLRPEAGASVMFASMLDDSTQPAEFRPDEFHTDPFFADSVMPDSRLPDTVLPEPSQSAPLGSPPLQPVPLPAAPLPSAPLPLEPVLPDSAELDRAVELPADAGLSEPAAVAPLAVGAWFELRKDNDWKPTQLTWANAGGTLFLFTSPSGGTHSMTRRSLDKFLASGKIRVAPGQATLGISASDPVGGTPYQPPTKP